MPILAMSSLPEGSAQRWWGSVEGAVCDIAQPPARGAACLGQLTICVLFSAPTPVSQALWPICPAEGEVCRHRDTSLPVFVVFLSPNRCLEQINRPGRLGEVVSGLAETCCPFWRHWRAWRDQHPGPDHIWLCIKARIPRSSIMTVSNICLMLYSFPSPKVTSQQRVNGGLAFNFLDSKVIIHLGRLA